MKRYNPAIATLLLMLIMWIAISFLANDLSWYKPFMLLSAVLSAVCAWWQDRIYCLMARRTIKERI
jgi:hypothetical protein